MITISKKHEEVLECLKKHTNNGMVTLDVHTFAKSVNLAPNSIYVYVGGLRSLGLIERVNIATYKILPNKQYVVTPPKTRLSPKHPLVKKIRSLIHRAANDRAIARTLTYRDIAEKCQVSIKKVGYAMQYMRNHGLIKPLNITNYRGRSTVYDCIDNITCVVRNRQAKVTQVGK